MTRSTDPIAARARIHSQPAAGRHLNSRIIKYSESTNYYPSLLFCAPSKLEHGIYSTILSTGIQAWIKLPVHRACIHKTPVHCTIPHKMDGSYPSQTPGFPSMALVYINLPSIIPFFTPWTGVTSHKRMRSRPRRLHTPISRPLHLSSQNGRESPLTSARVPVHGACIHRAPVHHHCMQYTRTIEQLSSYPRTSLNLPESL